MNFKLDHIHLLCKDLEGMRDFFIDSLGATLIAMKKFGGADGASMDLNGTTVNLRVTQEGETITDTAGKTYGYHHIGLKVDDVDAAYEELTNKGFVFSVPLRDVGDHRISFFEGPENVTFELLQDT